MINILAIGNSFSQDATHYLNQIAKEDCVETKVVNLYIGGCSLERHWSNVQSGAEDYLYELNGKSTEKYISIQEALKEERWDYIVTQQASHDSGWTDTYEPFLENLTRYIRKQAPWAEILLQETWAYEIDSQCHSVKPFSINSTAVLNFRNRYPYVTQNLKNITFPIIPDS